VIHGTPTGGTTDSWHHGQLAPQTAGTTDSSSSTASDDDNDNDNDNDDRERDMSAEDRMPHEADEHTPAEVWRRLQRGNEHFVAGDPRHPRQDVDRRTELAEAQAPAAALFGCSDSRLAAEIIFDMGLGDLFVVRNAGQVISEEVLGSLEYAVAVLHVPLILVLGHDGCGAVRAAIDSQAPDAAPLPVHIEHVIEKIVPAVRRVAMKTDASLAEPDTIDALMVGREHLRDTVGELVERSEVISAAVADGTLAIVGANYRLLEGRAVTDIVVGVV
jgi:carbonic anhydrase